MPADYLGIVVTSLDQAGNEGDPMGESGPIPLIHNDFVIGSLPGSNLVLSSKRISRRHARLYTHDEAYWVEDLGSRNGTVLNGRSIIQPTVVKPGDRLEIDCYSLRIVRIPSDSMPAATELVESFQARMGTEFFQKLLAKKMAGQAPDSAPGVTILVYRGRKHVTSWRITEPGVPQFIGRHEGCQLRLDHARVSRRHASVLLDWNGHAWLEDTGSANGVRINGQRVTDPVRLQDGDVVRIHRFRLIPQGLAPAGPSEDLRLQSSWYAVSNPMFILGAVFFVTSIILLLLII